jgi:hypothetical protein
MTRFSRAVSTTAGERCFSRLILNTRSIWVSKRVIWAEVASRDSYDGCDDIRPGASANEPLALKDNYLAHCYSDYLAHFSCWSASRRLPGASEAEKFRRPCFCPHKSLPILQLVRQIISTEVRHIISKATVRLSTRESMHQAAKLSGTLSETGRKNETCGNKDSRSCARCGSRRSRTESVCSREDVLDRLERRYQAMADAAGAVK